MGIILFDRLARAHPGLACWLPRVGSSCIPQLDSDGGFQLDSGVHQVTTCEFQLSH
jgi:hypothetical protein